MKTERKTVVTSISGLLFLLVIIIAGVVILNKNSQVELLSLKNESLNETIELRDSMVNEMVSTFDEIEENLSFVRNKKDQLVFAPQEGQKNQKEALVADIKLMNEMLDESSKKIDELDKKLKKSGIELKSFKNKIAQLNKYIAEQDKSIRKLKFEVEQRDYKIAEMDAQMTLLHADIASKEDSIVIKSQIIADKSQTIAWKEDEINKAYFAVGTHNELIKNGVLAKEGGFLGIGKNTSIRDDLNESYFTKLDIRNASHFPLNTKKAKLISEHPANSYRMVAENDKIAYLEIENPQEFWKLTKYVVVETKK